MDEFESMENKVEESEQQAEAFVSEAETIASEAESFASETVTAETGTEAIKNPGIVIAGFICAVASIVLGFSTCCCLFCEPVVLICAIVGLVLSLKGAKAMMEQYGFVTGFAKAAKILSIIALVLACLNGIYCIVMLVINLTTMANGSNFVYNLLTELGY